MGYEAAIANTKPQITEATRRSLFDRLTLEGVTWYGRLSEPEFLDRIYPLAELPSYDYRFKNAAGDVFQHRIMNDDWSRDWIFADDRFDLLRGDDETLLRFLCEMVHPVVRPHTEEVERLCAIFNEALGVDGFEIVETERMSGKPIFRGRAKACSPTGISNAKSVAEALSVDYVVRQTRRIEASIASEPDLAIGTAKEFLETISKTILAERGESLNRDWDLPRLVKEVCRTLGVTPSQGEPESVRRLAGSLATTTHAIAELRNNFGTGHGKSLHEHGPHPRYAKLAAGAATALATFLFETHQTMPVLARLSGPQQPITPSH